MRKVPLFLVVLIFITSACNCASSRPVVPDVATGASEFKAETRPRKDRRRYNRHLMEYVSARTVSITRDCSPKEKVIMLGEEDPKSMYDGRGTGIIVRSKEGKSYIFTAAHVVKVKVQKHRKHFVCDLRVQKDADVGGKYHKYPAKILSSNDARDIAVLEVDTDLGVSSNLEEDPFTGEDVWAVGYPTQLAKPGQVLLSITKGTLATKNVPGAGGMMHRVTAQVYFGNSGGGIWNKEGRLVGIVVGLYAGRDRLPYEGYYYIKPVTEVLELLKRENKLDKVFGE